MNMDRLYDLAFKFRESKLWNYVYEDELFAVKLSDERTAYCSIMGSSGQHVALAGAGSGLEKHYQDARKQFQQGKPGNAGDACNTVGF